MYYNELLIKLSYLTKRNNIKQTEIGKFINKDRSAMNKRAKFNSKFSKNEIEQIEKGFNISLSDIVICENYKKRQFDENIPSKQETVGNRINQIQEKNLLSNEQMAALLNISDKEYSDIKNLNIIQNIKTLNNIKQNFKISIDWLLYDE